MINNRIINKLKRKTIKEMFLKNNIEHIYLFWSYARWENKKDSDLDIIYDTWDKFLWLFQLIRLKEDLENKLKIRLDMVEQTSINKHYKPYIEKDKILIF